MEPQLFSEWTAYVKSLAGMNLRSKAIAINTQKFMDLMKSKEDFTTNQVKQIILLFVRQLVATGQKIPEGGAYDLVELARLDPIARVTPIMGEFEVQQLISRQVEEVANEENDILAIL